MTYDRRKSDKLYYLKNKDRLLKYRHDYYYKNQVKISENAKRYKKENRERHLLSLKKDYQKHRNKRLIRQREYRKKNEDKVKKAVARWYKNHLNSPFKGSHGHHIDIEHVIYIHADLHNAFKPHNHKKPETLERINWETFKFLMNEMMS